MIISRKSWHYRIHVFVFTLFNFERYGVFKAVKGERWNHKPSSLCGYFWSTVTLTALTPCLAIVVIVILPFMGLAAVILCIHDVYRYWRPKPESVKPGLVKSYLVARKSKVCPLIELAD